MNCSNSMLLLLCHLFSYHSNLALEKIEEKIVDKRNSHQISDSNGRTTRTPKIPRFLLFGYERNIGLYNFISKTVEMQPIKYLKEPFSIDLDMKNNCLYWSDWNLDHICRQCPYERNPEMLVTKDLTYVQGIALDWISHNLYFADDIRQTIELIRVDTRRNRMRKTILDSKTLKRPFSIAVHPRAGYMFWTDAVSEDSLIISRADLDGSNVKNLLDSTKIETPTAITVDCEADRIYWVDWGKKYIGNSDLGFGDFKVIDVKDVWIHRSVGVTVFGERVYWSNWDLGGIFSADKNTGDNVQLLQQGYEHLVEVKVFGDGLQTGTNGCVDANCDYICVGLPEGRSACLCPDGIQDCSSRPINCSKGYFACADSMCIPEKWKCDGDDDCGDDSDEVNCPKRNCTENEFTCDNGRCVNIRSLCNMVDNCKDGSDEVNCGERSCSLVEFTCDNGRCIYIRRRCNRINDCGDGSDEMNCPNEGHCIAGEFTCKDGHCVDIERKCDERIDCSDHSDEMNCRNCTDLEFACDNGICLSIYRKCNGINDCVDNSDEVNCPF